ncbi:UNVERIFIED_CONTAM: universal stress protein, partial [Salmonella enterica subsp. enterica serovar Weltevreden]
KANGIIREGRIYKTILEVAGEIDCDSIVMGTMGAEGLGQITGSNSSRVIAQADVPVVVVKEKQIGEGYKNIVFPVDLTLESKQKTWW